MKKKVLVTGGLGYIGSHTVVELLQAGYEVVIIDNLINAQKFILDRIDQLTSIRPVFYEVDLCNASTLKLVFEKEIHFDAVIHFAALKAVGESVKFPLKYFKNNLISLINLLELMELHCCKNFLFSSSATVYGNPDELPLKETTPFKIALSAYGSTKQMGEDILEKVAATGNINVISLRYFNPVGAHESALIGELPLGIPNNLMPFVTQAAIGKQKQLTVFGNDYPTPDGSCIRDYIHVVDLAKAHVQSCDRLLVDAATENYEVFNIGTGIGFSVLQVINAFEEENNFKLNYIVGEKRNGDAAATYADVTKANTVLKWKAEKGLSDMVKDAWKWEQKLK
jgi:UDP-glucose 4-epimerase